jgi:choloylglycine hydrolase
MIQCKDCIFLCKNFDWEDGEGLVKYNPAGRVFSDPESGVNWQAKYSSVSICYRSQDFTLGGMNEKGLVIEELSTVPFSFKMDETKVPLNEFQWVQYHLDNCASVEEVVQQQHYLCMMPVKHYLHYIISDVGGNSAIIEFGEDGVVIYRNENMPYAVLSNNLYENSLAYLKNFVGFGGSQAIPGSNASCDRFVTAVQQSNAYPRDGTCSKNKCFALLDKVKNQDTQWQLVYDIPKRKIYLRSKGSSVQHAIDVLSFNQSSGKKSIRIEFGYCLYARTMNNMVTN